VEARKNYYDADAENEAKAKEALEKATAYYQKLLENRSTYEEAARISAEHGTQAAINYLEKQREAYANAEYAPKKYSSETEKAMATAGNAYHQSLEKLNMALSKYNETGSNSAKLLVESCIKEVEQKKGEFHAVGGTLGGSFVKGIEGTDVSLVSLSDEISKQLKEATKKGFEITPDFDIGIINSTEIANAFTKQAKIIKEQQTSAFENVINANLKPVETSGLKMAVAGTKAVSSEWTAAKLNPIGLDFANGFATGINMGVGPVRNAAAGLARLAVATPKNILAIRSPSRVMRDEVGKMIPLGMAAGITENSDKVVESFDKMLEILDYHRKFDIISEDEYYTELEKLRDNHFAKGTKEWLEYTEKIYSYEESPQKRYKRLCKTCL